VAEGKEDEEFKRLTDSRAERRQTGAQRKPQSGLAGGRDQHDSRSPPQRTANKETKRRGHRLTRINADCLVLCDSGTRRVFSSEEGNEKQPSGVSRSES
jgi:hypothetical protein